jgi:NAD(P)-dependent dehydrogenase (short-subunit alcohol dehydrogenase family)
MARRRPLLATRDPSFTWAPPPALDLRGRTAAVVGGTDGIGRAIARRLADLGADVVVVGRNFRDEGVARLSFRRADLSSMAEAGRVGAELAADAPDLLVLTTGIMAAPTREVTAEGIERDLAVSFLSRLALVRAFAPAARRPTRVFVMGYPGTGALGAPDDLNAERSYDAFRSHGNTVAGNEALVVDGPTRFPQVRWYGLNPGLIRTNIRANYVGEGTLRHRAIEWLIGLFTPSPERYAQRIVPLLVAPELDGHSGRLFGQKGQAVLPTEGFTPAYAARFLDAAENLLSREPIARSA